MKEVIIAEVKTALRQIASGNSVNALHSEITSSSLTLLLLFCPAVDVGAVFIEVRYVPRLQLNDGNKYEKIKNAPL